MSNVAMDQVYISTNPPQENLKRVYKGEKKGKIYLECLSFKSSNSEQKAAELLLFLVKRKVGDPSWSK